MKPFSKGLRRDKNTEAIVSHYVFLHSKMVSVQAQYERTKSPLLKEALDNWTNAYNHYKNKLWTPIYESDYDHENTIEKNNRTTAKNNQ